VGKVFLDSLDPFVGIGIDGMSLRVDDRTELEDKLLEPKEVEFLRFSLVEQLDIDVSHQVLDFVLGGQEEELVVFEELDDFDSFEGLVSLAVVLKVDIAPGCILTAGVPEKNVSHDLVILLEQIVNVFDIPCLHQLLRVKLQLSPVFYQLLPEALLFQLCFLPKPSQ
jgi:hypothetical protein